MFDRPRRTVRRAYSRIMTKITEAVTGVKAMEDYSYGLTKYDGAVISSFNEWWRTGGETADDALIPELAKLRERSRDLLRNNPVAVSIIDSMVKNVVGPGLRPQPQIAYDAAGISKAQAKELSRLMRANFKQHAKCIDFEGKLRFNSMQRLAFRQLLESGEFIAVRRYIDPSERKWAEYGSCWQLLEPDHLATPPNNEQNPNIRSGIEFNDRGEVVAYWISKKHPGDSSAYRVSSQLEFNRIPAYDEQGRPLVLHKFIKLRPNQSRGVPLLAAIIETLLNLKQAVGNELIALLASSCLAYFIETQDPAGDVMKALDGYNTRTKPDGTTTIDAVERMVPGGVLRLFPGEKANAFMPNRPAPTFKDYIMFSMRWAGSAAGIPYEKFTHDWSNTTYTSGRMSEIDFGGIVDVHQQEFSESFCEPIWELSVEEQMLRGHLPVLRNWERRRSIWTDARWIVPVRPWVDPLKDVTAKGLALEYNLTTLSIECDALGLDWEEVLEQHHNEEMMKLEHMAEYQKRAKALGVELNPEDKKEDDKDKPKEKYTKKALLEFAAALLKEEEAENGEDA